MLFTYQLPHRMDELNWSISPEFAVHVRKSIAETLIAKYEILPKTKSAHFDESGLIGSDDPVHLHSDDAETEFLQVISSDQESTNQVDAEDNATNENEKDEGVSEKSSLEITGHFLINNVNVTAASTPCEYLTSYLSKNGWSSNCSFSEEQRSSEKDTKSSCCEASVVERYEDIERDDIIDSQESKQPTDHDVDEIEEIKDPINVQKKIFFRRNDEKGAKNGNDEIDEIDDTYNKDGCGKSLNGQNSEEIDTNDEVSMLSSKNAITVTGARDFDIEEIDKSDSYKESSDTTIDEIECLEITNGKEEKNTGNQATALANESKETLSATEEMFTDVSTVNEKAHQNSTEQEHTEKDSNDSETEHDYILIDDDDESSSMPPPANSSLNNTNLNAHKENERLIVLSEHPELGNTWDSSSSSLENLCDEKAHPLFSSHEKSQHPSRHSIFPTQKVYSLSKR